jgi:hypothetical protein
VNSVAAKDGYAACGDPDTSQCVGIYLVLLHKTLAFLMLQTRTRNKQFEIQCYQSFLCKQSGKNFVRFSINICFYISEKSYHVDAAMLAVMYLVVSNDRVAVGANLNAGQSVTMDIVVLNETAALAKYIHATLVAIVDLVAPDGGVTVGGHPDARKIV